MLIFYWTFRRVPGEVWEAAQLDGAGAFRTWWTLGVPAARAAFAAVGVLTFVYYWREFNEPLIYIQTVEKYTLSVGLAYLEQLDPTNWPLLLAGLGDHYRAADRASSCWPSLSSWSRWIAVPPASARTPGVGNSLALSRK